MVAGGRFELPMHLAYETGVVTTLPATKLEYRIGFEPMRPFGSGFAIHCIQPLCHLHIKLTGAG